MKELYGLKGSSSEFLLYKELFATTVAKYDKSIEKYLMRLTRLTDDLQTREITLPDKIIVAWALNYSTSEYEHTVAIIANSDNISVNNLFSQLSDESRRLHFKESSSAEVALPVKTSTVKNNDRKCVFYKRKGYFESNYWKKHPEKKPKKANPAVKNQLNS